MWREDPSHDEFWWSLGFDTRPEDWQTRLKGQLQAGRDHKFDALDADLARDCTADIDESPALPTRLPAAKQGLRPRLPATEGGDDSDSPCCMLGLPSQVEGKDSKEKADNLRIRGESAAKAGDQYEAIRCFTEAITYDAKDPLLYYGRSGCYAALDWHNEALRDAVRAVELRPEWPEAFARRGASQLALKSFKEAAESYKAGLRLAPDDDALQKGLERVLDVAEIQRHKDGKSTLFLTLSRYD
eukprot:gnl/TRDRNA2_/TRDRNA2_67323_c0_seq1.p1 gnl/TRDRNA2_/TRDRNA2_67323_c0~~gnl/TRDRNA2_/TRDRNA2_67323_c0_seq1.p1  ORF type:complete len:243 (+),score=49.59 gnl/TRDRNA2_/TRDRNA2_67323_c0_seq1:106-834(+)